jgi:hypothetical protein
MFIYFLEQVWCDQSNLTEWSSLGWDTLETQRQYWDHWNQISYKHYSVYPFDHMEINNDYIEF